jgi:hypothetical protein
MERFEARNPITYAELLDCLQYHHGIVISADTLRHRMSAINSVKITRGIPMEAERVAVDPAVLTEWYKEQARRVEGVPRQFVFNVDETGCCDYADRREFRVLVPAACDALSIPVPVNRHSKRSRLTAWIAADGNRMRPFVIVERVTAERELADYGYDSSSVAMVSHENAFMTSRLFEKWGEDVFFPEVRELRVQFQHSGRVVLLMDGLRSHHTDAFLQRCQEELVDVVFLIPTAPIKLSLST